MDSVPDGLKKGSISEKVVAVIDEMFRLERRYRDSRFTAVQIKESRNGAEFKEHLDRVFETIEKANPESNSRPEKSDKLHSFKEETIKDIVVKIYQVRFEDIEKGS